MNRERITFKTTGQLSTFMEYPLFLNLEMRDVALTVPRGSLWLPAIDRPVMAYVESESRVVLRGTITERAMLPFKMSADELAGWSE